jgi:ABC-type branched-subunit amino acid transport system ATPase component
MGSFGFLLKTRKRPDKDETGLLRASTDLYYQEKEGGKTSGPKAFSKGERVVLEIRGVSMNFGGIMAVNALDFQVREREILSVIGPNGAGKTTLFNLISGIYPPSAGSIAYEGRKISGLKPHQVVKAGVARTFQNLRLFGTLSVLDNAKVARFCHTQAGPLSILFHLPSHKREEEETDRAVKEVLSLFGARLTGYRLGQQALFLSYANRRRLEIARALSTDAKLLLLDEPSAGMNPQETEEITGFIKHLRDQYGYTIIVIEHKLNVVKNISDKVIALDYGRKIAEGTYEDVANDKEVIEAYLGRKR